ncbi:hypothetical protein D6D18_05206 [Aureobasidium pullulans]|nr:hypothetical protein D6D26_01537 [Aureobasidium pullulans]THW98266.1 hypothetical protein D6D18_05206 [Aureobasidium pullulans]
MSDWPCDSCDREFGSWDGCVQHMDALGHWKCDTCGKMFGSEHAVEEHERALNHWDPKRYVEKPSSEINSSEYKCDRCKKPFSAWDACRQHMNALGHSRFPHDCDTCEKRFRTDEGATQHMNNLGHWERLYCRPCKRYFKHDGDLGQHMDSPIHTRADPIQRPAAPSSPPIARPVPTPSVASRVLRPSVASPVPAPRPLPVVASTPVPRPPPVVSRTPTTSIAKPPLAVNTQSKQTKGDNPLSMSRVMCQQIEPTREIQKETPQRTTCPFCRAGFGAVFEVAQHLETSFCHVRPDLNLSNIYQGLRKQDPDSMFTVQATGPDAPLYRCPYTTGSCGGKLVPSLTALLAHLEGGSCGFISVADLKKDIGDWSDIIP